MKNYNSDSQTTITSLSGDVVNNEPSLLNSGILETVAAGVKNYMESLEQRHPGITDQLVSTTIIGTAVTLAIDAVEILVAGA